MSFSNMFKRKKSKNDHITAAKKLIEMDDEFGIKHCPQMKCYCIKSECVHYREGEIIVCGFKKNKEWIAVPPSCKLWSKL